MSITNIRRMLCLLLTFVAFEAVAQVKVEPGVSQELAQYRAKHVRDVTYDLSFKIPDKKIYGVEIEEEITFKWDGEGDLQLDFQGKLTYALIKNTHLDNSYYQDEHIVIPAKYLKKGRNRIKIQGGCSDKSLNRQDDSSLTMHGVPLLVSTSPISRRNITFPWKCPTGGRLSAMGRWFAQKNNA